MGTPSYLPSNQPESNVTEATTETKSKTVYTEVTMADSRVVKFPGKTRALKTQAISPEGTVTLSIDFLNGQTRTLSVPSSNAIYAKAAAHGISQRVGDSYASAKNIEDAVMAAEATMSTLDKGLWSEETEGGASFAGAHIVVRAVAEAKGIEVAKAKELLEKKLADSKAAAEASGTPNQLSRAKLYAAFRNPESVTGKIIARMEKEEQAANAGGLVAEDLLATL